MNRFQTTLAVLLISAGIAGWQFWKQTDLGNPPATGQEAAAVEPLAHTAEREFSAGSQPEVSAVVEDQAVAAAELQPDNCTWETVYVTDAETGEVREPGRCVPDYPPEPDPYESFSSDTLANMVYGDAHAAEVLGLRLLSSDEMFQEALGLTLLYRSVALSGDTEALRKAIGKRYAYTKIDGAVQTGNLKQLLILSIVGKTLGDERFQPEAVESLLLSADTNPDTIAALRVGAAKVLEQMAEIQTEVTGNSTIREAIDNA